jgi:hypothetical protein
MTSTNDPRFLFAGDPLRVPGGSLRDETLRVFLSRYLVAHQNPLLMGMSPLPQPGPLQQASEPSELAEQIWFATLERERSDVASLARFALRVDFATFHLCIAFEKADVRDFELSRPRNTVRSSRGISSWYAALVNATFNRYRDLRNALVHPWTVPAEVEPLAYQAFFGLCDLTPADSQLRTLVTKDRSRAFHELARHLDIVADQLKLAVQLAADLEIVPVNEATSDAERGLDSVQAEILTKAGEPLSLTKAAARLGISRQALHKRIRAGTSLGVMRGSELVVPAAQFVERDGKLRTVEGLRDILSVFNKAGAGTWSALQFLTDRDPLLKATPFDVLKGGDKHAAAAAARGYLSLDEA